ncbi:MAG: hypothetical protein LBT30_06190 [Clostridiales bacterium]|nr:hypothetical protein [Clostridiales bacterium]
MKIVFESNDLAKDYRKANARMYKILFIFCAVLLLLGIISLTAGIIAGEQGFVDTGVSLIIYALVFGFYMFLFVKLFYRRQMKTNKMYFGGSMRAVFENDAFFIFKENEICKGTTECKYEGIFKVYEYKEIITVMTSNMTAFMLNKNNVVEGSFDELRDAMRQRIGVKYKLRTKI